MKALEKILLEREQVIRLLRLLDFLVYLIREQWRSRDHLVKSKD
jgi:hypothetical protein